MRKLSISNGLLYFLDELEYTEAGLSASPMEDVRELAAPFQDAINEWDAIFKSERGARRAVTRAEAMVAVQNENLDSTTIRLGAMVRAVSPALMSRLFTMAPGKLVRRSLRDQCEKTHNIIIAELAKLADDHLLKPFGAQLTTLSNAALAALDDRAAARGQRQVVSNEVDEWKEGINALRSTTYAELLLLATENGFSRSWVETYFRSAPGSSSSTDDEPGELPATPE